MKFKEISITPRDVDLVIKYDLEEYNQIECNDFDLLDKDTTAL